MNASQLQLDCLYSVQICLAICHKTCWWQSSSSPGKLRNTPSASNKAPPTRAKNSEQSSQASVSTPGRNRSMRKTPANRRTESAAQRTPATNGKTADRKEVTNRKAPKVQKKPGTAGRKSRKGLATGEMTHSIALWYSSLFIDGQWNPSSLHHPHPPYGPQYCPLPTQTSIPSLFNIWMGLSPCFSP